MNTYQIYQKLNTIFSYIFNRDIQLKFNTIAPDVEGWDSLTHMIIISEIEDAFQIRFTMEEILNMRNVADMVTLIEKYTN
jgi:acyl carrier protein